MSVATTEAYWADSSEGEARWNMVNQDREPIVAHLNSAMGEAIYRIIEARYPFATSRGLGIIPINHVLRYRTSTEKIQVGQPLVRQTKLWLHGERDAAGVFRRLHLKGTCDLIAKAPEPVASGEYWIALTKPFAPPDQRRIATLPDELAALTCHGYDPDALPLQDIETFRVAAAAADIEIRDEIFHLNQTDLNRHVNTIVYLDMAQDRVCDLAHRRGFDVGTLRFRELDVFYRKPFTAGHPYRLTIALACSNGAFAASVEFAHLANGQAERTAVAVRLAGTGG